MDGWTAGGIGVLFYEYFLAGWLVLLPGYLKSFYLFISSKKS